MHSLGFMPVIVWRPCFPNFASQNRTSSTGGALTYSAAMKGNVLRSRAGSVRLGAGPHRNAAFTLIELLVAIAIIVILAGLLVPTLSQAKQKIRMSRCINNLKQLGVGISLYMH